MAEKRNPNAEIEEYRDLMETPTSFEEGFTSKAVLGVIFVALIMVPGNMYLALMIGGNLGAAAEWVTIILFGEIVKRSFTSLKRQETYLLFYVAASLMATEAGILEGGPLFNQYLVQSSAAKQFGIAKLIPTWVSPQPESTAIIERTFLHGDWLVPIGLLVLGMIIGRISWFTMGYVLFRVTSDYERLPFPFAPVNAMGATALAESTQGVETWRWRVFSAGAMIGLVFGAIYVALPAITGALLTEPITLIPIPFIDFTQVTGNFIPATPLGFTAHLGPIFAGLVIPFWGVMGTFLGLVAAAIANPILYNLGYLTLWHQGMGTIETYFVNNIDFWMSFGIGTTLAIAFIGFWQLYVGVRNARAKRQEEGLGAEDRSFRNSTPEGRGDFPIWVAIALFSAATAALIAVAWVLLPEFGRFVWFFLFFGFIFTPIQSFVNARLVGMVGQTVEIPFVREATILLSGYRGVDIWFIPFPLGNYGNQAMKFREIELTGTKFTSILKAETFMIPIILASTFIYGSYIWKLAPIPSSSYPYAQLIWNLRAYERCLFMTGTMRSELEVVDSGDKAQWTPANLIENEWWYWRVSVVEQEWLDTEGKRGQRAPWSALQSFHTRYEDSAKPIPERITGTLAGAGSEVVEGLPLIRAVGPGDDEVVDDPRPLLGVESDGPLPDGWLYYFEIDTDPQFTSPWIQHSTDVPWLYRALKVNVIAMGTAFGLVSYILLSIFGLPVLLIFGFIRALTTVPHFLVTEVIGALLARYYFWKKYGKKEWLQYAPILAVGFACGMALMGMASVSVALIQKSVSVLIF